MVSFIPVFLTNNYFGGKVSMMNFTLLFVYFVLTGTEDPTNTNKGEDSYVKC